MMKKNISWYDENGGFFNPGYLKERADVISPERTKIEVDFIEKLLQPGMKVFDLACGHGRHIIELARRGYEVTGLDNNSFFLDEATKAANRAQVIINYIKSDMRQIPFENEFDMVINLFTSFGYLENDEEDEKVIAQIAKALKTGGKFVIDFVNRDEIMKTFRDRNWKPMADDSMVIVERKFDMISSKNYEKRIRIWNDGRREEINRSLRLYTLTELIKMCAKYGLIFETVYGDYESNSVTVGSNRYILITQKK